ncbi:MAG: hypothetical protein HGA31_02565 [Candidatus Moranbacteria bacterium]|nr:hypothetical protein [Candidatus Moranbacteria bacterium]
MKIRFAYRIFSVPLLVLMVFLTGCFPDEPAEETTPSASLTKRFKNEAPVKEPSKFAIVISGNSDDRYQGNTSIIYQVLLENGYRRSEIYILDGDGDRKPWYPVDGEASNINIRTLIRHLRDRIRPEDRFFVYTTDHGDQTTISDLNGKREVTVSTLSCTSGNDINANEFASYFSELRTKHAVFVFDQCYGGRVCREDRRE